MKVKRKSELCRKRPQNQKGPKQASVMHLLT